MCPTACQFSYLIIFQLGNNLHQKKTLLLKNQTFLLHNNQFDETLGNIANEIESKMIRQFS